MIAAIMMALNEGDIIEYTLRHLHCEGIDRVYIAHGESTDNTGDILNPSRWADGFLHVYDDTMSYHAQPRWMEELAFRAGTNGAEWVLPIDCDEFWYACDGGSIADTLHQLPDSVRCVSVPMIRHMNWNLRMDWPTLPKIGFRYEPGVTIANGNHACSVQGEERRGVLALRELHYRGLAHFQRKTRERNERIDPGLGWDSGTHQRIYAGMSDEELEAEWTKYTQVSTSWDPIPTKIMNRPPRW